MIIHRRRVVDTCHQLPTLTNEPAAPTGGRGARCETDAVKARSLAQPTRALEVEPNGIGRNLQSVSLDVREPGRSKKRRQG